MKLHASLVPIFACLTLGLASCAGTAESSAMTVTGLDSTSTQDLAYRFHVDQVTGAPDEANWYESEIVIPEFIEALELSLGNMGWLEAADRAGFGITAEIISQNTEMKGLDAEAWVTVRYVVSPTSGGAPIYDHTIETGFYVPHGVAFTGVKKVQLALEGAAKDNIAKLLEGLAGLN